MRLGTAVAIGFARNPMVLANIGYDLQSISGGRFVLGLGSQIKPHIEKRYSEQWSRPAARMREMVLAIRAIWDCWQKARQARLRGRVLPPHADDAGVRPRPQPLRPATHLRRRVRAADARRGRRGGRRPHPPSVQHAAHGRGARAAGRRRRPGPLGARPIGARDRVGRQHRDLDRRGQPGRGDAHRPRPVRVLRLDAGLRHHPRAARLPRPPHRAQPPVEGGQVAGDGRPLPRGAGRPSSRSSDRATSWPIRSSSGWPA